MTGSRREGTVASLAPTVCSLLGLPAPGAAEEGPLDSVLRFASAAGALPVGRCLVYCPDAVGDHLQGSLPDEYRRIGGLLPLRVRLSSVLPPKTPVCFASAFTGASPAVHGIRRYERPVLSCDTLFDTFIRAGRRAAIVAVRDSSIDTIFRSRDMDYFSEEDDEGVTDRALTLVAACSHDLLVVYHQEYDDLLHLTRPLSREALEAAGRHFSSAAILAGAVRSAWQGTGSAMVVAPDHGAHADPGSGRGDHGLDVPEDMEISHWYGIFGS